MGNVLMLLIGIAERIREEQAQIDLLGCWRVCVEQIKNLGRKPKLGYSERAELHFEPDQAPERRADHRWDRALSLILLNSIRDVLEHTKQERAGPHRGVGQSDVLRRQALRRLQNRWSSRSASSTSRTMAVTISGGV